MRLGDLDDRYLPGAAGWLRRRVDTLEALLGWVVSAYRGVRLDALDERYGGWRPLALLRETPVVALVTAGVVLVSGVTAAYVMENRHDKGTAALPGELFGQGDAPRGTVLGPRVGDDTRAYVQQAMEGLIAGVQGSPDKVRVALVSLDDYRTPEEANALLTGYAVRRVFLRAPAGGPEAATLPIEVRGPLLPALRKAFAATATTKLAAQKSFQGYVAKLHPTSTADKRYRDLYQAFARSSGIEADEYAHNCACVYSVLVTATPTLLVSLRARPGIRAIELANLGLDVTQVQAQPMLPEVKGVVPRQTFGTQK